MLIRDTFGVVKILPSFSERKLSFHTISKTESKTEIFSSTKTIILIRVNIGLPRSMLRRIVVQADAFHPEQRGMR